MPVNLDKPQAWNADITRSVDMFNLWFTEFAPRTYRETRVGTIADVKFAFSKTNDLTNITPDSLLLSPGILPTLRMSTCPPLAVSRLVGLADVSPNLVRNLERDSLPARMKRADMTVHLSQICRVIVQMLDSDILVWLKRGRKPSNQETDRAATVIADRLCGSLADPAIRNAQEHRQLSQIEKWLKSKGYTPLSSDLRGDIRKMPPGTYSFRMNVPVGKRSNRETYIVPVDVAVMRKNAKAKDLPLLIEAKSAGDYTNTNKRRKEEAQKVNQLRHTYGQNVEFILFLCGYFDSGFLGYEAAEGIDWVWEHRINDFGMFRL